MQTHRHDVLSGSVEENAVDGRQVTQSLSQEARLPVESRRNGLPPDEWSRALSSIEDVDNVVSVVPVDDVKERGIVNSGAIFSDRFRSCDSVGGSQQTLSTCSGERKNS